MIHNTYYVKVIPPYEVNSIYEGKAKIFNLKDKIILNFNDRSSISIPKTLVYTLYIYEDLHSNTLSIYKFGYNIQVIGPIIPELTEPSTERKSLNYLTDFPEDSNRDDESDRFLYHSATPSPNNRAENQNTSPERAEDHNISNEIAERPNISSKIVENPNTPPENSTGQLSAEIYATYLNSHRIVDNINFNNYLNLNTDDPNSNTADSVYSGSNVSTPDSNTSLLGEQ